MNEISAVRWWISKEKVRSQVDGRLKDSKFEVAQGVLLLVIDLL